MIEPSIARTAPDQCRSLEEIRSGMDSLDRQLIRLIAERVAYVHAAAQFKTTAAAVSDQERIQKVLRTRREWAERENLDGGAIEAIYRDLVAYCVSEEQKRWQSNADH